MAQTHPLASKMFSILLESEQFFSLCKIYLFIVCVFVYLYWKGHCVSLYSRQNIAHSGLTQCIPPWSNFPLFIKKNKPSQKRWSTCLAINMMWIGTKWAYFTITVSFLLLCIHGLGFIVMLEHQPTSAGYDLFQLIHDKSFLIKWLMFSDCY